MWGHIQRFAMSIGPSVPLQLELKEQKCEAAEGGEFPGCPFRGYTLEPGCRQALAPELPCPCAQGWAHQVPASQHCPYTTSVPKSHVLIPGWMLGGEAVREVPQACPSMGEVTLPHLLPFPNDL